MGSLINFLWSKTHDYQRDHFQVDVGLSLIWGSKPCYNNIYSHTAMNICMATREILQLGNPLLLQQSSRVEDCSSTETRTLIQDLSDTLAAFREAHGYGRGIAAVQIGVLKRVIFIRMPSSGFCSALINPEITWVSRDKMELWDDCFSFPDLTVKVERTVQIKVVYLDAEGKQQTIEAKGDLSELLQHEIDHLDGILAIQRAVSPTAFATRMEWERRGRC